MFIGHFGLSFGAKKLAPQVSLGTLFIATQFVDILWPFLLLFNIEKVEIVPGYTKSNAFEFLFYPYTHSLLMGVVWGLVTALLYWAFKRDVRSALVIGACVLSHWFLDLVVHVPDLPLSPFGDTKVGLGLWNHVALTLLIEGIIYAAGIYLYITSSKPKNKKGQWGLWLLITLLVLFSIGNLFSPPPTGPLIEMVISFTLLMIVIIGLAYWVDRNREAK